MKTLLTKSGIFHVGIIPEKSECDVTRYDDLCKIDAPQCRESVDCPCHRYESDLKTAVDTAIQVEDQESARLYADIGSFKDNHIYHGIPVPTYTEQLQTRDSLTSDHWYDCKEKQNVSDYFYRTIARFEEGEKPTEEPTAGFETDQVLIDRLRGELDELKDYKFQTKKLIRDMEIEIEELMSAPSEGRDIEDKSKNRYYKELNSALVLYGYNSDKFISQDKHDGQKHFVAGFNYAYGLLVTPPSTVREEQESQEELQSELANIAVKHCHWKEGEITGYDIIGFEVEVKKLFTIKRK